MLSASSTRQKYLAHRTESLRRRTLLPTLTSGKVYRYAQVALQAFNKFLDAESAGKHYNTYFKPFLRAGGLTAHVATPELRRAAAPGSG